MCYLASHKSYTDFDFVSIFKKTLRVPQLKLKIMLFNFWFHFHLFEVNNLLVLPCYMTTFALLIFKFTIIHQAADRRLCFWRNLN